MSVGPATRAALSSILIHQALRDRDAALHARWHRALEDLNAEPPGPIRHHIEQHDAAVRRAAMTDVLSKGETPTTARIRGAIEGSSS